MKAGILWGSSGEPFALCVGRRRRGWRIGGAARSRIVKGQKERGAGKGWALGETRADGEGRESPAETRDVEAARDSARRAAGGGAHDPGG